MRESFERGSRPEFTAEVQQIPQQADTEIQRIEAVSLSRSREQDRKLARMETDLTARISVLVRRGLADLAEDQARASPPARRNSTGLWTKRDF